MVAQTPENMHTQDMVSGRHSLIKISEWELGFVVESLVQLVRVWTSVSE